MRVSAAPSTSGGPVIITQDDWTGAAFSARDGKLVLDPRFTFDETRALTLGTEGGYTVDNWARVTTASSDENTTTLGVETIVGDTTATGWSGSTQTAWARTHAYGKTQIGRRVFVAALIKRTTRLGGILTYQGDSKGRCARTLINGSDQADGYIYNGADQTTTTALSAGAGDEFRWVGLLIDGLDVSCGVIDSSDATLEPTEDDFTWFLTKTGCFTDYGKDIYIGRIGISVAGVSAYTVECKKWWDWWAYNHSSGDEFTSSWGATQLDTGGYVAQVTATVPAAVTVSDADLQSALTAAIQVNKGYTDGWTFRASRGGAPSVDTWYASGSVTLESATGADLYIDAKFTSDGTSRGGLRPMSIRTS